MRISVGAHLKHSLPRPTQLCDSFFVRQLHHVRQTPGSSGEPALRPATLRPIAAVTGSMFSASAATPRPSLDPGLPLRR